MSEVVVLERTSTNGIWSCLFFKLEKDGGGNEIKNTSDINEDDALWNLLDDFENDFKFVNLRSKILQGFIQLRENDFSGNSQETMEISVETEDLVLRRSTDSGYYISLNIKMYDKYGLLESMSDDANNNNEDEVVFELVDDFVEEFYLNYLTNENLRQLRFNVIQGFNQLRLNNLGSNSNDNMTIHVVVENQPEEQPEDQPEEQPENQPEDQPESHLSCKKNPNEDDTSKSSAIDEIAQSEVQQKLAIVEKNTKVMKFFEDNKCSVCLSNYKQVLNDDLHIVIPSCGHPLCCGCADNVLMSERKLCPFCRGSITVDSFNIMKFKTDLQMVTQDQRVFL